MAADQSHYLSPQQAVCDFLDRLDRPARLLVAVSGGSDSVGLLSILFDRLGGASRDGVSLFAATVDHGLRPESAEEAKSVAKLCRGMGVPHLVRRWDGAKPLTGLSAAAREARYRLLVEMADEVDATAILTGHTFEDQRETVAMRAARKQGDDNLGLAGMAEAVLLQRRCWLLRPFLFAQRADIRAVLGAKGMGWVDDPSNLDPHYERVRMRQGSALDGEGDPAAVQRAAEQRTALSDNAAALLHTHLTLQQGVLAHLPKPALAGDALVRRHALALLASVLGGRSHLPAADTMNRIMAFVDGGLPGRITAGRVMFDQRREGLYLHRESRNVTPVQVSPGAEALWDDRYRISNNTDVDITAGATITDRERAQNIFPGAPASIAMRIMAVMPQILPLSKIREGEVRLEPVLAPYDRFLPVFDINLGRELAAFAGCDDFPRLPIKLSMRKS